MIKIFILNIMWRIRGVIAALWWMIRGVTAVDYRLLCARCGRTGQAHWGIRECIRFKSDWRE